MIVATSCVQNEYDIFEAWARHTLQHVDRLVVMTNDPKDPTLPLIRSLIEEGAPIEHVVKQPTTCFDDGLERTKLMKEHAVAKWHADWILPLDADEFIQGDLTPIVQEKGLLDYFWITYTPQSTDDLKILNPVERIRHRQKSYGPWIKVIVPKDLALNENSSIDPGGHGIKFDKHIHKAKRIVPEQVHLAHFPMRSAAQYATKVTSCALKLMTLKENPSWYCWHSKRDYNLLKTDPDKFQKEWSARAMENYTSVTAAGAPDRPRDVVKEVETIDKPIKYQGSELKYTSSRKIQNFWQASFQAAIDKAEQFAKELSKK